ncbi:prolipoprotein diacylglyceryl transferase [Paenibacillus helianthi]|uniref:Phosphatidylglycerol--prolipoprotein diacylglyceryl transferase n=1 Tax=Paenibacillus helianthi TaxID=1349432 RepID=A0ABX3EP96_9BACL|nr:MULTISPECIES: prolipoprotein diacylglyceryl transferase [Paenibacillus]OKP67252.1 prolipoprotein diacylglyceryl transferase [Paenibacillus sp. P3E]OKP87104.1 prolipoprotein diacylglyceryl transferase [Paenibacillus helianthi]
MFFSLAIDPIVFSIGSLPVHWYGLILGVGALVGLLLAIQEGKRFNISQEFFMDMLLLGLPSAIIGARIYYVAFKWEDYKDNFADVFKIWNGGIAIYGALIGAVICGMIYFRYKGYPFWRIVDICAPGLLAGQMIGRWGNFVNQEAYGGVVEESFLRDKLHLPDFIVNQMYIGDAFHHPTFLYESLWSLLGILLLMVLRRQKFVRAGEIFLSYFIWYSIGRFFIEALRTDSLGFQGSSGLASFLNGLWSPMKWFGFEQGYLDPAYGNIRSSQLLALLTIVAAIIIIIVRRVTGQPKDHYSDPIISTKAAAVDTIVPDSAVHTPQSAPPVRQPEPDKTPDEVSKE